MNLTDQQLNDIETRAQAATDGPWDVKAHAHAASGCRCLSCDEDPAGWTVDHPGALFCDDIVGARSADGTTNQFGRELTSCETGPLLSFEDASFAAHARTDVPALASEVRRLRAALPAEQVRAIALLEAADFLRDTHFRDGLSVQEIGAALRHTADNADAMVGSLARDGFGADEIAEILACPTTPRPAAG